MLSIITGRRPSKNLVVWGGLLAAAISVAGCDKVPLLAPSGSTVTLSTNSTIVQANGTAEIRATVLESSGTPVQNGTTVTFSTNLGSVSPNDARTVNGVATVQFIPNGQSGTAKIVATSGGAKADATSNPLTITVGGAAAGHVQVTASPNRLPSGGGNATVTAVITDTNGNPLSGVGVSFSTTAGTLSNASATTNSSGQAVITLTTNREATVTATTGTTAGTGTVVVSVGTLPAISFGTVSPANPTAGQVVTIPLTITITTGNDTFQDVIVNWGDGTISDLGAINSSTSVSHPYASSGIFTVTATGTGSAGDHTQSTTQVSVSPRSAIGISMTAAPNPTTRNTLVTFTVTYDGTAPTNVSGYDWTFGDGNSTRTSGKTTSYAYPTVSPAGGFPASVTVNTTDGNSGSAQTRVVVNP